MPVLSHHTRPKKNFEAEIVRNRFGLDAMLRHVASLLLVTLGMCHDDHVHRRDKRDLIGWNRLGNNRFFFFTGNGAFDKQFKLMPNPHVKATLTHNSLAKGIVSHLYKKPFSAKKRTSPTGWRRRAFRKFHHY